MAPKVTGSSPLTRGKLEAEDRSREIPGLIPAHAGKTGVIDSASAADGGSSPLTRGKLAWHNRARRAGGLIPAHAGKTDSKPIRRRGERAHPRSRGENEVAVTRYLVTPGSSPLTRGKLVADAFGRGCGGLIPAHAGKTRNPKSDSRQSKAHPRSRGENILAAVGWVRS
mgnify:CR=1 FL=1